MREGRMRPCHYVGAEIPVLGTNAHWNEDSEYLVAEGDESDGTLVNYIPEHSIVLNIEPEHLDHYKDLDEIKAVFDRLCSQTRGRLFIAARIPALRMSAPSTPIPFPTAGPMRTTPLRTCWNAADAPCSPC